MNINQQPYQFHSGSKRGLLMITLMICLANAKAQSKADSTTVKKLLTAVRRYNEVCRSEKLYLHFDKPYYAVGDTAWFKAYALKGTGQANFSFFAGGKPGTYTIHIEGTDMQGYFGVSTQKITIADK